MCKIDVVGANYSVVSVKLYLLWYFCSRRESKKIKILNLI